MPARRLHVRPCGDLETSYTDVLLYFAAYVRLERSGSGSQCLSDQAFHCRGDRI
jgi:hypothetical protein